MTDYPFSDPAPAYPFGDPGGVPAEFKSDYADAEQRAAANLPLDQWGRYKLPRPDGIQPAVNKGLTRVSTTKSTGQNQDLIQAKTERKIVEGIAAHPELHAAAVAALQLPPDSKEQRKAFAAVAQRAFILAGGNERRDQGTEVHLLIDAILKGGAPEVPEKYQPDIAAYFQALEKHDLTPVPGLSEVVVVCPYEHGGAIDNIMRYWNPDTEMYELVVVDTKSGRTLDFSRVEFLSQTWMYSNAYYSFVVTGMDRDKDGKITTVRGYVQELPLELRQDRAIIIHLPMDGTAEAILLDLAGWDRVVAAQITIRQANAEAKHRYRSLGIVRPDAFEAPLPGESALHGFAVAGQAEHPVVTAARSTGAFEAPDNRNGLGVGMHEGPEPVMVDPTDHIVLTPAAPTPDAAEQARLAAERRATGEAAVARLDAAVAPLRNDDPDDAAPPPAPTHDPVTGRKKRTCGHCHLPGHTQKNCPKNPASPKFVPPLAAAALAEQAPAAQPDRPIQPDERQLQAQVPYCLALGHTCGWTAQHPAAPGQWVCSITGKPAKHAYEAGLTRMTAVPPAFGHPEGKAVEHLAPTSDQAVPTPPVSIVPVPAGDPEPGNNCDHLGDGDWHPFVPGQCDPAGPFAADSADGDDAPPPPRPVQTHHLPNVVAPTAPLVVAPTAPGAWPEADMTSWGITQAKTVQDLLTHRQREIDAKRWTPAYDAQGQARYGVLVLQEQNRQAPPG